MFCRFQNNEGHALQCLSITFSHCHALKSPSILPVCSPYCGLQCSCYALQYRSFPEGNPPYPSVTLNTYHLSLNNLLLASVPTSSPVWRSFLAMFPTLDRIAVLFQHLPYLTVSHCTGFSIPPPP